MDRKGSSSVGRYLQVKGGDRMIQFIAGALTLAAGILIGWFIGKPHYTYSATWQTWGEKSNSLGELTKTVAPLPEGKGVQS